MESKREEGSSLRIQTIESSAMKENSAKLGSCKAVENSGSMTVQSMKVISKTTSCTARESTPIEMVQSMKVNLKKENSMVKEH